jgi:hypothetical protein
MNQSFAFEFLCEKFQPKLINSYSNFKRLFHFLLCDLGREKFLLLFSMILGNGKNLFIYFLHNWMFIRPSENLGIQIPEGGIDELLFQEPPTKFLLQIRSIMVQLFNKVE